MGFESGRANVITHDEARTMVNDAFNALASRAMHGKWDPDALRRIAERRRHVLEYLDQLKRTAEGKETQR
jgi:intergrase/recombinase